MRRCPLSSLLALLLFVLVGSAGAHQGDDYLVMVVVKSGDAYVSGAKVSLYMPEGSGPLGNAALATRTTGGSGLATFRVAAPGRYRVKVEHDNYETANPVVDVRSKDFPNQTECRLKKKDPGDGAYLVNVTVKHGDSFVSDARVSIYLPAGQGALGNVALATKTTGPDGRASFDVSSPGNYRIRVEHEHYKTKDASGEVKIPTSPAEVIVDLKATQTRIKAVVVADDTGDPIEGATVSSTATNNNLTNRVLTDHAGVGYLLIGLTGLTADRFGANVTVTASHPDFESQTGYVRVDAGVAKDYDAPFRLKRKGGKKAVVITVLEVGSRAPVQGASVLLDDGANTRAAGTTDGAGRATISVEGRKTYKVDIRSSFYEAVTDSIRVWDEGESRTYEVEKKETSRDMRRVLVVTVITKTKGVAKRVQGANVATSGGLHDPVTDANGVCAVFHKVPPGDTIRVSVTKDGFAPAAGNAMVRDKGTMVDVGKLRGAYNEAWKKQIVHAVDNITIELKDERSLTASLSGDVIPNKGRAKIGESVNVQVAVLYAHRPDVKITVKETVELWRAGKMILNNLGGRTLQGDNYSRRNFNIVAHEHGTYTLKSTITGPNGLTWTDKASFDVVKPNAGTVASYGTGVFKLKDKVVGKVEGTGKGPDGAWSASIGESAYTGTYESIPIYDSHATFNANWSSPPPQLKPGDIIELTVTSSGRVWGKDAGSVGMGPGWDSSGSIQLVEHSKLYCGRGSDGKDHPGGAAKFKFKVGSGGQIKIWSYVGGAWAGDSGGGMVTTYTYIFEPPATTKPSPPKKGKTTMTSGGG